MTSAVSGSPSRSARRRPSVSVWSDGSETIPPSCSTRPRITTDSPPPAGRSRGHHPDLAKDLHGPLDPGGAPVSKDLDLLVAALGEPHPDHLQGRSGCFRDQQIGRAHVCTPV